MNSVVSKVLIALLLTAALAGCAEPTVRVLWPAPPLVPQLEFIGSYRSALDLQKKGDIRMPSILASLGEDSFFIGPYGITADSKGRPVISDITQKNLRRFDFVETRVDFIEGIGSLALPSDLCFDTVDQLYILDGHKGQVTILNSDLTYKTKFFTKGILERPVALAINESLKRIYISDVDGDRIGVYSITGEYLFSFGMSGSEDGQFNAPQGIAIHNSNLVFIADMFNARVQVFDAEGRFQYKFGQRGSQLWNFEWPKDLAFDSHDNLFVIDQRKAIVTMRRPNGDPILALGESPTRHELGFASPVGIAIDKNDRIYITDRLNRRFTVWQSLTEEYLSQHPITEEDISILASYLDKLTR